MQVGSVTGDIHVHGNADNPRDDEFRRKFLGYVESALDEVELFGVDVRNYKPRAALSVSYISLTVRTSAEPRRGKAPGWSPGALRTARPDDTAVRVERALAASPRTLVRGEAGSGKSTLLRWLAVTAARGSFGHELAEWNGRIPFLVKLRRHTGSRLPRPEEFLDGMAAPISGLMPAGWAHRQLSTGRALLLVDGVDELPTAERANVRSWLAELLAAYPTTTVVVTSRPAAIGERWLTSSAFTPVLLDRMGPADTRALIAHWHVAVREAGDLPCAPTELPKFESALLARLDASRHLRAMAANPLVCAVLCALNLDREAHLPHDRMALNQAAIDMLLERRDAHRNIVDTVVGITARDKLQLLQQLAWRLSINNMVETTREDAAARIAGRLGGMPQLHEDPVAILDHLVGRSGVLREPVPGRIDFVHRTFQEYLTAREAAEQGDIGLLVDRGHLDSWRETVVMAAGHANAPLRRELLVGLLDRAQREPRHARTLRLLAASCLETIPSLEPPNVLLRVQTELKAQLPPRNRREARSLAAVGEPLLAHLPRDIAELSEGPAAAAIRAAALVNGPRALALLSRYATDGRARVQAELARVWEYFDPHEYVDQVLADAPLVDGALTATHPSLLTAIDGVSRLTHLRVQFPERADLRVLDGVPHLREVRIYEGITGDLAPLREHPDLELLSGFFNDEPVDPAPVAHLHALTALDLWLITDLESIEFVADLTQLKSLELGYVNGVADLSPMANHRHLRRIQLHKCHGTSLSGLPPWEELHLVGYYAAEQPVGGLRTFTRTFPSAGDVWLNGCVWATDLGALVELSRLTELSITGIPDVDLAAMSVLRSLRKLHLGYVDRLDLSRLQPPPGTVITIVGVTDPVDLSPLAGQSLTVVLINGQKVAGADVLGPGVRLKREWDR